MEKRRSGPLEAGFDQRLDENREGEVRVSEAEMEAEVVEEAEREPGVAAAVYGFDEELLDVAGAEAGRDEGAVEGKAPALLRD